MMKKIRGFQLGWKLVKVCKWIIRPRRRISFLPLTRISSFVRRGMLCDSNPDPGYIQLGAGKGAKRIGVPKGHLAVYVGESEGSGADLRVQSIGWDHVALWDFEFEKVKTKIADWNHCRRKQHRRYL
ncbi:hypothetical protein F3Y22_tig00110347pilonHSYRG00048 [Hibiscus syriacus]|uniref:Uncharacterized protein n=1 Tax=Hibiscus syriacus TaxID=106335 RepID=A0A6A3AXV3_HIBSY|nr:hypothetical protein F3Y22_tig00110347pilonHSYRG00048 [Hibiscus syriacus]